MNFYIPGSPEPYETVETWKAAVRNTQITLGIAGAALLDVEIVAPDTLNTGVGVAACLGTMAALELTKVIMGTHKKHLDNREEL